MPVARTLGCAKSEAPICGAKRAKVWIVLLSLHRIQMTSLLSMEVRIFLLPQREGQQRSKHVSDT